MRSRILTKSKHAIDSIVERVMEWSNYLCSVFKRQKYEYSNLSEVYTIKSTVAEEKYVQNFIKERSRIIGMNRYRMSIKIDNNYKESQPGEIGKVTLYCKERYIDEAILVIKPEEQENNRLIYWKFNK